MLWPGQSLNSQHYVLSSALAIYDTMDCPTRARWMSHVRPRTSANSRHTIESHAMHLGLRFAANGLWNFTIQFVLHCQNRNVGAGSD